MSTKVEPYTVEPHTTQSSLTANTSAVPSGTKISFVAKKGFVIPKNKLSGSLVPTFRGGKKGGTSDVVDEESNKQLQRKTKWGPDLTQDAGVRKARALAYQTRVDQITEQLKSGFLDTEDNQESLVAAQNPNLEFHQKSELLELERREAIAELLKLNPSYKPPSDYKPLLKDAKVPVPIKEHPEYNFIGIIFGPSSDTLKRLEKETGAKVRVYGTRTNTREKVEITSSDPNEARGAYEELYVHIYADTYEKVDAAVALIELLVKPVSVKQSTVSTTPTSVSGEDVNIGDQTQSISAPNTIAHVGVNPEFLQPITGPVQTPLQAQFQPHSGPWSSLGSSQPSINPPNMFPFFGPRPVPQRPFMPQGHFGPPLPPQPPLTGFSPVARPLGSLLDPPLALPHGPHPASQRPTPSGPAAFANVPPHMSPFILNQASGIPSSLHMSPFVQAPVHSTAPNQTPISQPMSATVQPPLPLQARTPSFTPVHSPPFMNQNQQTPNLDNFTFPPQRPPNQPSQTVPRPVMQNMPIPPQNQPYRPVTNNPLPQSFLEELARQQMNPNRSQFPPSQENSNLRPQGGPRNLFPVPPSSHGPYLGPRNLGTPFPPRPGNSVHPQSNFSPTNRLQNFSAPNIQLGSNASISVRPNSGHGSQQVYDPFSPE